MTLSVSLPSERDTSSSSSSRTRVAWVRNDGFGVADFSEKI